MERSTFKLVSKSKPNYWYFKIKSDYHTLLNRIPYQKHRQEKILEKFDPEMSEPENMRANGYDRIFDCGNLVFIKENKKTEA